MISTRVMDFKLREAAEGLGEDSTGKALTSPALGRVLLVGLYGAGRGADGARPLAFSSWRLGVQVTACSDSCQAPHTVIAEHTQII